MKRKPISVLSLILIISITAILRSVEFGTPFSVMKANRKLTNQELIRAIRMMVSAEYEAVQLYMQLAESIENELAKKVLVDIANEERIHAGEFLKLLKHLAPDEEKFYKKGTKEVIKEIEKLKEKKKN